MKFIADENVDTSIVELLRKHEYSVDYILEISPGISDQRIIELADKGNSILITADKDFGELTFRHKKTSIGIVLFRLPGMSNEEKAKLILKLIETYKDNLIGTFTVLTRNHIRIKHMP